MGQDKTIYNFSIKVSFSSKGQYITIIYSSLALARNGDNNKPIY